MNASRLKKRSLAIAGHATSVALEDAFWDVLEAWAQGEADGALSTLIERLDAERPADWPLASYLRVRALERVKGIEPSS